MPRSVFYHCSRSIWALEGQSRQSGYSLVGSRTVLRCAEQQAGSCKKRRPTFKHKVRCEPQPHSCLHSPASLSPLISSLLVFTPNLCFYLISGRPHPTTSPPSSRSTHALSPCHRRRNLYPTLSISQYKSHAYSLSSRPLGMCASRLRASAQAADGACVAPLGAGAAAAPGVEVAALRGWVPPVQEGRPLLSKNAACAQHHDGVHAGCAPNSELFTKLPLLPDHTS